MFITKLVPPYPRLEKELTVLRRTYDVKVICWDRECRNHSQNNRDFIWFRLKAPYGKPSLFIYLIFWWIYQIKCLIKEKYDIIHAFNLDTIIFSVILGKLKNKKIIYDVADFYSDSLPEGTPKFIRMVIGKTEIFFAKQANFVFLADDSRIKQFKFKLKRYLSIYNSPIQKDIKDVKINNKGLTIFFGGVLYLSRGLKEMIEVVNRRKDVKLIIAGYGGDEEKIKKLIEKSKNITFLGKINYDTILSYTKSSDILFALYDPNVPNHKFSSPNKLFEAMMLGKPIIVNKGTSMDKIVKKEKCGLIIEYGNLSQIDETINKLKSVSLRNELGKNGKRAYKEKYNWNIMERKILEGYDSLK